MSKGFCIFGPERIMAKERIILSVINDLVGDQRIHRIASTLQEASFDVEVIGRRLPDSLAIQKRSYKTHRMRLMFHKGKMFYLEYNIRLFCLLLFRKVDILNSNDLDTLLPNFLIATIRRRKLVYDSHEYFTEVPELIDRPKTRGLWLALEKWIFPRLQIVYTVNESLANIYTQKYNIPVSFIRNVPTYREAGSSQTKKRLIYQGALNLGRGIELMIDAMEFLEEYELWIVGRGDIENALKSRAEPLIAQGRKILFTGFVRLEDLPTLTDQAGIGLSLEEDLGLNYRYASPNKVFDYLQAGLVVLVSDLPEMTKLIKTYQPGEVLKKGERTPQELALKIRSISEHNRYQRYQKNACLAARELNWENEKGKLLTIYKAL